MGISDNQPRNGFARAEAIKQDGRAPTYDPGFRLQDGELVPADISIFLGRNDSELSGQQYLIFNEAWDDVVSLLGKSSRREEEEFINCFAVAMRSGLHLFKLKSTSQQ